MTDVHAHVGVGWFDMDVDQWAEHFRGIGVDRVWLLGWECWSQRILGDIEFRTEDTEAAVARHPDLFVPFCSLDPRDPDFDARFDHCVERGFRGFGEMKLRLRVDNDDCKHVYARCAEVGWPVLFHVDRYLPPRAHWYMTNVERLEAVLQEFPDTIFIGHGPGWWAEISGDADEVRSDYPDGPVLPGGRVPRLLREHENLHADLSAGSGYGALTRDPEWGRQFVVDFSDKLMYGTDENTTRHLDLLRSMDLPAEVFVAVTEGNARRLVP